jgi:hypothetical protein
MKYLAVCLVALFLLSGTGLSQTGRSAVGTLVSNDSGTRAGEVCLKIKRRTSCFQWDNTTKFQGFRTGKGWDLGSEWRITYRHVKSRDVLILNSATFTGRIIR